METDEPLETGYGRATPAGDNLCNDYAQALADALLALARARGAVIDDDDPVVALGDWASPSIFANVAIVREPVTSEAWPDLAERTHRFFGARDGGPFLVWSAWPTPDLRPLEFGRIGHPPLMLRPPGPVDVRPVEGLVILPVTDAETAAGYEFALVMGFPDTALQPVRRGCFLPEPALEGTGWQHWVGMLDGRPVAASSAYRGPHHLGVEFIATVEEARGRGIGRAMTAVATSAAPELPALLIASDMGRPLYERLGYRAILRYTLWQGHRRGAAASG